MVHATAYHATRTTECKEAVEPHDRSFRQGTVPNATAVLMMRARLGRVNGDLS
jgi:hypothetical protein